ncbi:hypothetical protein FRC02_000948 [Tulasnella sp. 418]|nr:hypothetical protein FRC02_000948 [Tulasnella sp. 418]
MVGRPRIHATEEEKRAAKRASRERHRSKPGVKEKEREQCRDRAKRRYERLLQREEKLAQLWVSMKAKPHSNLTDPHEQLEALRKYVDPVDPIRCPNVPKYFKMENDMDGLVWSAFAPTVFQCEFEGAVQMEDFPLEADQRMIGQLARQEIQAAERRYTEVTAVNDDEEESNLLESWHELLDLAVVEYRRWIRVDEYCSNLDTFFGRMVQAKFPWVARHAFFLAEAVVLLERGRREFCAEWENGRTFRATERFLFSRYM